MEKLSSRRVPLAWFLMFVIAVAGADIIAMLFMRPGTPPNSVLIENHDEQDFSSRTPLSAANAGGGSISAPPISTAQATSTRLTVAVSPTPATLAVYVSGAVQSPGVYSLRPGARVNDAIAAAGGAVAGADLEQLNLAAYVSDQDHITVRKIGDTPVPVAAATQKPSSSPKARSDSTPLPPGSKLDLNTATARELEELPGIGPVLAARIVADREAHGPFRSIDDLVRVPGIKDGLLARFRDFVTVTP